MDGEDQDVTNKHNLKNRHALIKAAHVKLLKLEADRGEISADISEIKKDLKEATDMSMKEFAFARYLCGLEEAKRANAQDDLKESFNALIGGETLDWVVAIRDENPT